MGLKAKLQEKATAAQPAKLKVLPFPTREGGSPGAGMISQEALVERLKLQIQITEAQAALDRHDDYLSRALAAGYEVEAGAFDVRLNSKGRAVVE